MAMASNPNRNNGQAEGSQSSRSSTRRVDPAGGQSNVPVLFRLKNLQRGEPAAIAAEPTTATRDTNGDPRNTRSTASSNANQSSDANPIRRENQSGSPPVANSSNASAVAKSAPDPVTAPGKHGVSNGFILLAVAILIAFAVGRSSNKTTQVAVNSNTTKGTETSSTPTPIAIVTAAPIEPLAPPELPSVAKTESPAQESNAIDLVDSAAAEATALASKSDATDSESLTFGSTEKSSDARDEKLPAPSMLVVSRKEASQSEALILESDSSPSHESHKSLLVDSPTVNSPAEVSFSTDAAPTKASIVNESLSFGQPEAKDTFVAKEKPSDNRSKLVTTTAPEMDTAQLYDLRANYQSQMEAMARARQAQVQQAIATPSSQPTMQYASSQSAPPAQTAQANIAPPTQGYGANQYNPAYGVNQPNVNQPNAAYPTNQPNPAYGAGQPNPSYGAAQANEGYGAAQPNTSYGQPQTTAAGFSVSTVPTGRYVPIARTLSYPSNVPPNQQAPVQAYQPTFNSPPNNPAESFGQPGIPQGVNVPYPNMAPPFPN